VSIDRSTVWPYQDGEPGAFVYSRYAHPTGVDAERELAALEGAPEGQALLFASGSAAVTALLLALLF
jgi:cystathionine beta-lyase/cystathionine gamma-synthase